MKERKKERVYSLAGDEFLLAKGVNGLQLAKTKKDWTVGNGPSLNSLAPWRLGYSVLCMRIRVPSLGSPRENPLV